MNERDAALDVTTSGWWEVQLFADDQLVRRRYAEQVGTADYMIRDWYEMDTELAWDHKWDWTAFPEYGPKP